MEGAGVEVRVWVPFWERARRSWRGGWVSQVSREGRERIGKLVGWLV